MLQLPALEACEIQVIFQYKLHMHLSALNLTAVTLCCTACARENLSKNYPSCITLTIENVKRRSCSAL